MRKLICTSIVVILVMSICGCKSNDNGQSSYGEQSGSKAFRVAMVTDTGGVNDQSFNQSAWEGLQTLKEHTGAEISYLEPTSLTDLEASLDNLSDRNYDLIWCTGYILADALKKVSAANPEKKYAIADYSYGDESATPENVVAVVFKSQESSLLAGYAAGKTTKTNKVGFVGGIKSVVIDQFEYGFRAGVGLAAKEIGKSIDIEVQYAESFTDATKGKAIAAKMYTGGCDIILHAAGNTGAGVIEEAKDRNKLVIGVDRDQSSMAPDNMLTSALKNVNVAVESISKEIMDGKKLGGTTREFGIKEGGVGIPEKNKNMDPEVYKSVMVISQQIVDGEITFGETKLVIPYNEATYKDFATGINSANLK